MTSSNGIASAPASAASNAAAAAAAAAALHEHDAVTLELAKKECAEHLVGMDELHNLMKQRPLLINAYEWDGESNDNSNNNNNNNNNTKTKIVHFVRHGQGFHNLMADTARRQGLEWKQFDSTDKNNPYIAPELMDAPLTEKGRQQAQVLQSQIGGPSNGSKNEVNPQLVVSSTNCRALQTCVIVFDRLLPGGGSSSSCSSSTTVPFIAHEMAREETGVHLCDKRRSVNVARREFPFVDFSLIQDNEDIIFNPIARETKQQVGERVYSFLNWLYAERDETELAVCTHSSWLLTLFNGVINECDNPTKLKAWFQTGEMRSVKLEFTDATTD